MPWGQSPDCANFGDTDDQHQRRDRAPDARAAISMASLPPKDHPSSTQRARQHGQHILHLRFEVRVACGSHGLAPWPARSTAQVSH